MKLIDADDLKESILNEQSYEQNGIAIDKIEEAPTIDAIPVCMHYWNCIENIFSYEGIFDGCQSPRPIRSLSDEACEKS